MNNTTGVSAAAAPDVAALVTVPGLAEIGARHAAAGARRQLPDKRLDTMTMAAFLLFRQNVGPR